jgi:hypothetical protein
MKPLFKTIYHWSLDKKQTRNVFAAFILFTIVLHFMDTMIRLNTGGWGIVDMQLSFKAEKFYMILEKMRISGLGLVFMSFAIDFIYPIIYAVALIMLMMKAITESENDVLNWKFKIPFFIAGLDYVENISHLSLIKLSPQQFPDVVLVTSWIASIKWSFAILLLLWSIISYSLKKMDAQK